MRRMLLACVAASALGLALVPAGAGAHADPCPTGWFTESPPAGDLYDDNGNGVICTKDIPGDGDGNSANSQRGPGQTGFHVDGHNHKDDHVH